MIDHALQYQMYCIVQTSFYTRASSVYLPMTVLPPLLAKLFSSSPDRSGLSDICSFLMCDRLLTSLDQSSWTGHCLWAQVEVLVSEFLPNLDFFHCCQKLPCLLMFLLWFNLYQFFRFLRICQSPGQVTAFRRACAVMGLPPFSLWTGYRYSSSSAYDLLYRIPLTAEGTRLGTIKTTMEGQRPSWDSQEKTLTT